MRRSPGSRSNTSRTYLSRVDLSIASLPFKNSASTGIRLRSNSASLKSNDNGSTFLHLATKHLPPTHHPHQIDWKFAIQIYNTMATTVEVFSRILRRTLAPSENLPVDP